MDLIVIIVVAVIGSLGGVFAAFRAYRAGWNNGYDEGFKDADEINKVARIIKGDS